MKKTLYIFYIIAVMAVGYIVLTTSDAKCGEFLFHTKECSLITSDFTFMLIYNKGKSK